MPEQFFKPKPISYGKKQKSERARIISILGVLLFIVLSLTWLVVKKYSTSPFDKIDKYLKKQQIQKAAVLNYEMLEKFPQNRLAVLLNGSVINFAMRELNITDTTLPFYEYEDYLEKEDRSGVFTRQVFSKKYTLFPDSVYFLNDFCSFSRQFPETSNNPEIMLIVKRSLQSQTKWNPGDEDCMNILFSSLAYYKDITGEVTGDNLTVREKPDTKSNVIGRLKKGSIVLVKYTGFDETIGNKTGKWLYVLTRESLYGWVFGGYVNIR